MSAHISTDAPVVRHDWRRDELLALFDLPFPELLHRASTVHRFDYVDAYVGDLGAVLDMEPLRGGALVVGVDPLGGAAVRYWPAIADRYGMKLDVVNDAIDPTFRFMTVDWDGKIRMDPSSPHAMAC